jgi:hypothetical protein
MGGEGMSYDYEVLERHYNLAIKERDEARRLVKGWEEMARDGMVFDVDAVIKQRDDLQLKLQEARKLAEEWRDWGMKNWSDVLVDTDNDTMFTNPKLPWEEK